VGLHARIDAPTNLPQARQLIADLDHWRDELQTAQQVAAQNHCDVAVNADSDAAIMRDMKTARDRVAAQFRVKREMAD
jgi:hypothetical protein